MKARLQEDMKTAMRSKEKQRLGVIRLILAAIKQREVDDRIELTDEQVLEVMGKMLKQRRDSHTQYVDANRKDLADVEAFEIDLINEYMPTALTDDEVATILDEVIAAIGAATAQDMGKVMGGIKPRVQGRADMGMVSRLVKARLTG